LAQSVRLVRKASKVQLVRKVTSVQLVRKVILARLVRKETLDQLDRSVQQDRKASLVQQVPKELASPFLVRMLHTQHSSQLSRQEIQVTAILLPVTCMCGLQRRLRGSTLVKFKDRQDLKVTLVPQDHKAFKV